MSMGAKLKQRRLELGLSQKALAESTNLSLRTIQRIERNQNVPHGYTLRTLADALDMDVTTLAEEREPDEFWKPTGKLLMINLSVLTFLVIPFGNLIFPIVLWGKYKEHPSAERVGRSIVNFQISWSIVSYALLAISPFLDEYIPTPIPLIFVVLILAYALNIFVVLQTSKQLRAGEEEVCKRAFSFF